MTKLSTIDKETESVRAAIDHLTKLIAQTHAFEYEVPDLARMPWTIKGEICAGGAVKWEGVPCWIAVRRVSPGKWLMQEITYNRIVVSAPDGDGYDRERLVLQTKNGHDHVRATVIAGVAREMTECSEPYNEALEHALKECSFKYAFEET